MRQKISPCSPGIDPVYDIDQHDVSETQYQVLTDSVLLLVEHAWREEG